MNDLEQRLHDLGRAPLDPDLQERHLAAMQAVTSAGVAATAARRRWRFSGRAVAAATVVGFLAGSTGLAAAGSLPAPAQDVAHDVLGIVGIGVPRSTEGCPEGRPYKNHGAYVAEVEAAGGDVEAAAKSECGKPVPGGKGNAKGKAPAAGEPRADTDGDPCTGPPPWAGSHLPNEQRDALRAEREAQCGPDDDAAEAEAKAKVEEREAATTTTEPPATTAAPTTEPPATTEAPTTEAPPTTAAPGG